MHRLPQNSIHVEINKDTIADAQKRHLYETGLVALSSSTAILAWPPHCRALP